MRGIGLMMAMNVKAAQEDLVICMGALAVLILFAVFAEKGWL